MADSLDGGSLPPDVSRGPGMVRTCWVLTGLATVVCALRIFTKLLKTRRLYWDDLLLVVATILGIGHAVITTVAETHGLGRHLFYLSPAQRETTIEWGVEALWPGFLSPMFGRIGFCLTMLFLTRTDPHVRRWPIYVFIVLQVLVNVVGVIFFYTQCGTHFSNLWDSTSEAQFAERCQNPIYQTDYGYLMGGVNTLTDLFLTILPAVLIERTRLSVKSKIGLAFLLCLSIVAMVASIVKTYQARALSEITDYTYDLCSYTIWMSVELNIVIIVASIPLIRPLFRRSFSNQHLRGEREPSQVWTSSSPQMSTYSSRKGMRHKLSRADSEENIISPSHDSFPMTAQSPTSHANRYGQAAEEGITVMREVTVTYETSNSPFVHAALVGLIQGEIANPRLARR